ncbi:MAG: electron transport complex subunit E [Butyrivibrio sp.]|nr:electron transport complex subunit E [Butyrivibrio sp.]
MENTNKKGALGFKAGTPAERIMNGLIVENPTLVLMIGMCPTLAVTTSAINGLTMGLATTFVLALSNAVISLLRKVIPDTVRIPAFIVVIASFVTLVQLIMQAYLPAMYTALGVYIPLIVVNCIIFGRAEAYASKNGVFPAFFDGIGMGLGFTLSITCIGLVRELIGGGTAFDVQLLGEGTIVPGAIGSFLALYQPVRIFILQAGAFFVLAILIAVMNKVKANMEAKGKDTSHFKAAGCCQAPNAQKTFKNIEKVSSAQKEEKALNNNKKESEVEE